jgi:hypothetical protein
MSEKAPLDMEDYIDNLEPLKHDPSEEEYWQAHYRYVVNNAEFFSEVYVEYSRRQMGNAIDNQTET